MAGRRALTRHPETRKQVDAHKVIDCPKSFPPDAWKEAKAAEDRAADELHERVVKGVTVAEWRERWLTDPSLIVKRDGTAKADSTLINFRERTKKFCEAHGDKPLRAIGDKIVDDWIDDPNNWSQAPKNCGRCSPWR